MGAKSTRKDHRFSSKVCKDLSLWWSDGKDGNIFWRTSNSGARASLLRGMGTEVPKYQYGDITAIDPSGYGLIQRFCFELKSGYDGCTPLSVLECNIPISSWGWLKFWRQVEKDAGAENRIPALIHRRTGRVAYLSLPAYMYDFVYSHVDFCLKFDAHWYDGTLMVVMCKFEEFLTSGVRQDLIGYYL